ncbi:response regulator with CheY-like receiver domain and winged-helix DNA-binding domain [Leptolyngbyaceae cyanobacterium JSC-12]|nr:response regulator with CheY-like receiver domain and winged-helix DNA-binding domain [Leptolyngbyaceae cyanobacterium JSC-12]
MATTLTQTILIVDDTPSEMELIRHYLQESGYSVIGVVNANAALNQAIEHQPDAVITDVVMPGLSGFELCRSLKRHPVTEKTPIIICTSKSQEIDRLWGMKQGADFYLTKPFTREQLLRAVQAVVN